MEISLITLAILVIGIVYTIISFFGIKDFIRYLKEVKYYEYTNYEPEAPMTALVWCVLTIIYLYAGLHYFGTI